MRTIESQIFSFSELSQEAQKKAVSDMQNDPNYLDSRWYEAIYDDVKKYLGYMGMDDVDISFEGFYCQGDHANFTATMRSSDINLDELQAYAPKIAEEFKPFFDQLPITGIYGKIYAKFERNHVPTTLELELLDEKASKAEEELYHAENDMYAYQNHSATDEDLAFLKADTERWNNERDKAYENAEATLTQLHKALCKRIFNQLQDEYEYRLSDDAVTDMILANDYEFTADGTFYSA